MCARPLHLAVVAGWRFTPPPRVLAASVAAPLSIHIHTDRAMFQVLISPGKVGSNDFVLQLMTGDAALLPAKEAALAVSLPERGIDRSSVAQRLAHHARRGARALPAHMRSRR